VLDACAAPGGKTAHLLERAAPGSIEVTALEIDPSGLAASMKPCRAWA
jgi:16S rRNA (cytosine967-C5)-methyltransferase